MFLEYYRLRVVYSISFIYAIYAPALTVFPRFNLMVVLFFPCTRSGNDRANAKTRITQLENDVVRLASEAEEMRRFTEGYMVKASIEKQKVRPIFP